MSGKGKDGIRANLKNGMSRMTFEQRRFSTRVGVQHNMHMHKRYTEYMRLLTFENMQIITSCQSCLLQLPLTVLLDDQNRSVLIQTPPAGLKNGSGSNSVLQCWQTTLVKVIERCLPILERGNGINELLE